MCWLGCRACVAMAPSAAQWPADHVQHLLDGSQADRYLQHRHKRSAPAAARCHRPGQFAHQGTQPGAIPGGMLGWHTRLCSSVHGPDTTLDAMPSGSPPARSVAAPAPDGCGTAWSGQTSCGHMDTAQAAAHEPSWEEKRLAMPRWPGCPPAFRGGGGGGPLARQGESDDGGRWEVVEFWVRRASKASTRVRSCVSSSCRVWT